MASVEHSERAAECTRGRRAALCTGVVAALALGAASCGARSGLIVPDVVTEAGMDVVPDRPTDAALVCTPGRFTLVARAADTVFVIDRSGSMDQGLTSDRMPPPGTPTRWRVLEDALAMTLPAFTDRVDIGALFFPAAGVGMDATCALPDVPTLDVAPAPGNAAAVVAAVRATGPGGATPTYAALHRAYTWIVRHPDRARARYIVLTTDGGPNCNDALDPRTCTCVSGRGGCGGRGGSEQCLDDARTVELIHEIATNPATSVPTYVIGIAPDGEPALSTTLTAMAVAGGRPRVVAGSAPTFYSVRAAGDLAAALEEIQGSIARCTFVTPSRPDAPDGISLSLDGATIPRDATRSNGWDWTDESYGEITLFGPACDRAIATMAVPVAIVGCADGG